MSCTRKPDVGPEETVLLTEHHAHEHIKPFGDHTTQTVAQVAAALLSGTVQQGHGPQQQQETWKVFRTMQMAELRILRPSRVPS